MIPMRRHYNVPTTTATAIEEYLSSRRRRHLIEQSCNSGTAYSLPHIVHSLVSNEGVSCPHFFATQFSLSSSRQRETHGFGKLDGMNNIIDF